MPRTGRERYEAKLARRELEKMAAEHEAQQLQLKRQALACDRHLADLRAAYLKRAKSREAS